MLNRPWDTFANFVRRFVVLASVVLLFTGCVFAQTFTTLYSFDGSFGSNDGTLPAAALIRDADGNLYSTTARGGTGTDATVPGKPGTVFQLTKSGNSYTESVLYSFTGYSDGGVPQASLVMDAAGNLYGTTSGDSSSNGTVFELIKSGSSYTFTVLHSFTGGSDGSQPVAGLIMDAAGNLYGTAQYGGTGYGGGNGTVFELIKSGSSYTYTVLYSFNGGSDGATPTGTLVMDGAGNLYGTTLFGGDSGSNGTVFKLTNSGGSYTESLLHTFTGSDGANPFAGLIMDAAGNLYGTTVSGGTLNNGTVFKLTNSGNSYTESVLYNFAGGTDGATPFAGVIMDTAGNLYATTANGGGSGNYGTVFQLTKSGNSYTETVLHRFTAGSDGANPQASVIMDAKGNLYGTAFLGGTGSGGTVFELTPSTPFSKFSAKLQVSSTGFQLQGSFTQGAGAPAINPVTQPPNLTIGTYKVTIPAGSFHASSKGVYVYEGTINGVALQFRLVQVSQTSWTIQAEGSGVNLSTLTNPVTVTLAIGNNTGTIQLKAQH